MKNDHTAKPIDGKPRLYVITEKDAEASNTIVIGTIHLFYHNAKVLIDFGSINSFMCTSFVKHYNATLEPLEYELAISTPLSNSLIVELVYKLCVVMIWEMEMLEDLVLLDQQEFDVILGMDLLASHHATVDCYRKEVNFSIPNQSEVMFKRT